MEGKFWVTGLGCWKCSRKLLQKIYLQTIARFVTRDWQYVPPITAVIEEYTTCVYMYTWPCAQLNFPGFQEPHFTLPPNSPHQLHNQYYNHQFQQQWPSPTAHTTIQKLDLQTIAWFVTRDWQYVPLITACDRWSSKCAYTVDQEIFTLKINFSCW